MGVDGYVTIAEAAQLLDISPAGVRKAIQQRLLSPLRLSARVVLIPRAEVERYQRERRPAHRPVGAKDRQPRRRDRQRQPSP